MAKVGFWLRSAKGKLAGATLYQQNGETVMREVNTAPSNPKTTAQTVQRIIMHTVMGAYSTLKEICDHSFEGMKKGQDTMSYFMKQNIQFAREKIAQQQSQGVMPYEMYNYAPLGKRGFTPNQYQVAMGSLPTIRVTLLDPKFTPILSGFSANSYANVIKTLGLQRGDQLTFMTVGNADTVAPAFGVYEFKYARVILDPTNADGTPASLDVPFVKEDGTINLPSVRNEGNFVFSYNAAKQIEFHFAEWTVQHCVAAACIASRQGSNGLWLRSTQYLVYAPAEGEVYSLQDCIDAAKAGVATPVYTQNSQYLNNAGTGNGTEAPISDDPGDEVNDPTITSVNVAGNSLISGSTRTVTFPSGTELPKAVTFSINVANPIAGLKAQVMNGSTMVAEADVANGAASINAQVNSGITYSVRLWDSAGEAELASGYRVTFNVASGSDDGGTNSDE